MNDLPKPIPAELLDEQWFGFVHQLIGGLQRAFRASPFNQKQLGARLGKKPSFISRCLSGQGNMTIRTIYEIARAMGFRLEITFRPLSGLTPVNYQPEASWIDRGVPMATTAGTSKTITYDSPKL